MSTKSEICYKSNTYYIPTYDNTLKLLSLNELKHYIRNFNVFVRHNPHLKFWLTRVACGENKYKDSDIAPLFKDDIANCSFPIEWKPFIDVKNRRWF